VNEIYTITAQPAGFAMPASGCVRIDAFPTAVDATGVRGYAAVTAVAGLKGVFPGTSAWSPPIC
jgi:hypothetical protein